MITWLAPSMAARPGGLRRFGAIILGLSPEQPVSFLRLIPPRGPYTRLFGDLVVHALGSLHRFVEIRRVLSTRAHTQLEIAQWKSISL